MRRALDVLRAVTRRPIVAGLGVTGVALPLAALVVAVTVAERGRRRTLESVRQMGADVVIVSAVDAGNRGGRSRTGDIVRTLARADAQAIANEVPGVLTVAAEYGESEPVTAGSLARRVSVNGVDATYGTLRDAPLEGGRFFTVEEANAAERVAVIGFRVARDLYGDRDPVGDVLRIRRIPFTVVGMLAERGTGLDAFNEDEVIFIPLTTATRRLYSVTYVARLYARVRDLSVTVAIGDLFRRRHHFADVRIETQERLVSLRSTAAKRLRWFAITAASALLAAAAGGIAAWTALGVRARRGEIGVRRAVGATKPRIVVQILAEAALVCIPGALLGAGIGLVAGPPGGAAMVAMAGAACVLAGLAAASVPAVRAARMPPGAAVRPL
ncbi:MAG TPA: ABC transporter permease [Gemmatimonadaceae bacterium]|nr:ABC transporter permease [Gemmatimonadaceae bacterium]